MLRHVKTCLDYGPQILSVCQGLRSTTCCTITVVPIQLRGQFPKPPFSNFRCIAKGHKGVLRRKQGPVRCWLLDLLNSDGQLINWGNLLKRNALARCFWKSSITLANQCVQAGGHWQRCSAKKIGGNSWAGGSLSQSSELPWASECTLGHQTDTFWRRCTMPWDYKLWDLWDVHHIFTISILSVVLNFKGRRVLGIVLACLSNQLRFWSASAWLLSTTWRASSSPSRASMIASIKWPSFSQVTLQRTKVLASMSTPMCKRSHLLKLQRPGVIEKHEKLSWDIFWASRTMWVDIRWHKE